MIGFFRSRSAQILARGLSIWLAVFFLSRLLVRTLPGDPLETLLAETGTSVPPELLAQQLGLQQTTLLSLLRDLAHFVRGDWGHSILSQAAIRPLVSTHFWHTLSLGVLTLLWALPSALLAGLWTSGKPRTHWSARLLQLSGRGLAALSTPWIGPLALWWLAIQNPWFAPARAPWLPSLVLAIAWFGFWARIVDQQVRETLQHGSAAGARARGIPEWRVRIQNGLIPCAGPLLAYIGTQIGALAGGTVLTEVLFQWPGIGQLLVDAVLKRDYPLIEACVFVVASCALAGSVLGQLAAHSLARRRGMPS